MNWLDVAIAVFLVGAVIRGIQVGFIRQFCSTLGFFLGLFLGVLLEGRLVTLIGTPLAKSLLALFLILGCAMVGMAAGEFSGVILKFKLRNRRYINKMDGGFGAVIGVVTLLLAVWIGAAIFHSVPSISWQRAIRGSRILALLNDSLPPAPSVISRVSHLIDPNGFPQVFIGLEPRLQTDRPLPDLGALEPVVESVRPSVVMIAGEGCGGIVEGSGFVVDTNTVVTNAHVVAGVTKPTVLDSSGSHRATVVWFDPDLDLAVLKTSGLIGKPLVLQPGTVPPNTSGVVLGYPGGGGFTASPALVLEAFTAVGRDIYSQGKTERDVYSMKADIRQGNSGGPLIGKDGAVIGVVFAESTSYDEVGYALTMDRVIQEVASARHETERVTTGSCAQ